MDVTAKENAFISNNLESASLTLTPNYSYVFSFENNFDVNSVKVSINENFHLLWCSIAAYLLMIAFGGELMKSRERFTLKTPLMVWNFLLSIMSIFGAWRTTVHLYHTVSTYGFMYSFCSSDNIHPDPVALCWAFVFTFSKVLEFMDTVFIILRKQKLIFLHWFHHVTMALFTFLSFLDTSSVARYYIPVNYTVHSFMYSYYFLKAAGVKMPKFISVIITSSQIVQMLSLMVVTIIAFTVKIQGQRCDVSWLILHIGVALLSIFTILFVYFFRDAYMKQSTKSTQYSSKSRKKIS